MSMAKVYGAQSPIVKRSGASIHAQFWKKFCVERAVRLKSWAAQGKRGKIKPFHRHLDSRGDEKCTLFRVGNSLIRRSDQC
jgi:hypothetical protein